MRKSLEWRHVLLAMTVIGLVIAPAAAAKLLSRKLDAFIAGADVNGNPDWYNGRIGPGKITKDPHTGIILRIAKAYVKNDSGRSQAYYNISYNIYDPWTAVTTIATSDSTIIGRPVKTKSLASSTAIYDPHYW